MRRLSVYRILTLDFHWQPILLPTDDHMKLL